MLNYLFNKSNKHLQELFSLKLPAICFTYGYIASLTSVFAGLWDRYFDESHNPPPEGENPSGAVLWWGSGRHTWGTLHRSEHCHSWSLPKILAWFFQREPVKKWRQTFISLLVILGKVCMTTSVKELTRDWQEAPTSTLYSSLNGVTSLVDGSSKERKVSFPASLSFSRSRILSLLAGEPYGVVLGLASDVDTPALLMESNLSATLGSVGTRYKTLRTASTIL